MYGSCESGTVCSNNTLPTTEEIFAAMGYALIKVPREPSICPVFHQPEKPELYCDKQIFDKDAVFVVSGMGVVAGEELYKELFQKLRNGTLLLWWE